MKRFFQTIKKKRHKRRLSALWLFLIVMELFCPVLCDEPGFVAQAQNSPMSVAQNYSDSDSDVKSVSASASQAQDDGQPVCNDECLCHATPILSLNISALKTSVTSDERIVFTNDAPLLNSLSPPHRPPKIS